MGRKNGFPDEQDYAASPLVDRSSQRDGLAVDPPFSGRLLQMAGESFHESRLAGTVLADGGVNLLVTDRRAGFLHPDRAEGFRQPNRPSGGPPVAADGSAAGVFIRPWSIRFRLSKTLPRLR
jgi:hypothetical protein